MTRADLPPNPAMDEHHEVFREAVLEYLRDKTNREERKAIVAEAIDEWLDKQFVRVGKWTAAGLLAMFVAFLAYVSLLESGWHK